MIEFPAHRPETAEDFKDFVSSNFREICFKTAQELLSLKEDSWLEEWEEKFDAGAIEHGTFDLYSIQPLKELRDEWNDSISYTAWYLLIEHFSK